MKYFLIAAISLILLVGAIFLFSSSPREAITQPIRDEFAQRQSRGIKDSFKIEDVSFTDTSAEARVVVTHESGATEVWVFHINKVGEAWVIVGSEPYVAAETVKEFASPKLVSVEYYGMNRDKKPVDENGYPVYTFNIFDQSVRYTFDRPVTKPIKIKFERKHIGVYGGSSTTITLNPASPPSNIIWKDSAFVDAFDEKRAGNLGVYEDIYTIDGEATVAHFVVQ